MARKMLLTGLLAGTALRLTAAEQRVGRLLRSPDGHEPAAAPAAAPTPAPAPTEAPSAPAAPNGSGVEANTDAAYDAEFGDAVLPGSGDDEGEPAPKADEPGASEPEKKDGEVDPADALEAERHRANTAEARIRELEAEKGKEPPKKDDAAPATPESSDPAPNPEDYEFGEADSKFIADQARWHARQEFRAERAREQLTSELNTIEDGWKTSVSSEEFTAEYPDFDEVVTQGATKDTWECTPLMALAIKSSPVGGHVAYELAKNPAEASRIAKLIPVEQAYEIGRLEGRHAARVSAKKATPTPTPAPTPTKVASSAPPPPATRSRGAGGQYASELGSLQERMLKEF